MPTQIEGTSGGRSFARGAEDLSGWEGRLQGEAPVSWGQSRKTPSSGTDTDPEGRPQTPRPHCVQGRVGRWFLSRLQGVFPSGFCREPGWEVRVGRCGVRNVSWCLKREGQAPGEMAGTCIRACVSVCL